MPHFTYEAIGEAEEAQSLHQGDIIIHDRDLTALLENRAGFTVDPLWRGLMVISQTCDLVPGRVKADPILLVPLVPLAHFLDYWMQRELKKLIGNLYAHADRRKAELFLARLLNQNEQATGSFYLHTDIEFGVGESCIAALRWPVAVRAGDFYAPLQQCRTGRLTKEFTAQLGWLVGHLFNRPATRDFAADDLNRHVANYLSTTKFGKRSRLLELTKLRNTPTEQVGEGDMMRGSPSVRDLLLREIADAVQRARPDVFDEAAKTALRQALGKDPRVRDTIEVCNAIVADGLTTPLQ